MIVNVVIVSIGIGAVVEVVTPSGPPNIVALDTVFFTTISTAPKSTLSWLSYQVYRQLPPPWRFYNHVTMALVQEHVVQLSPFGVLRQTKAKRNGL